MVTQHRLSPQTGVLAGILPLRGEETLLKTGPRPLEEPPAVATRQNSIARWRLLARHGEMKGDYDQATMFARAALRESPHDIASMVILARLYEKQHEPEEAARWHQHILEKNPILRASNLFLAQWHFSQGAYEQALPYFERLWLLDPLFFERPAHRALKLRWLLTSVKVNGIYGLEPDLAEVRRWQDLTEEEHALRHALLVATGDRKADGFDAQVAFQTEVLLEACRTASQSARKVTAKRTGIAFATVLLLATAAPWYHRSEERIASPLPPLAPSAHAGSHRATGQRVQGPVPLREEPVALLSEHPRPTLQTRVPADAFPLRKKEQLKTTLLPRLPGQMAQRLSRTPATVQLEPSSPSSRLHPDSSPPPAEVTQLPDEPAVVQKQPVSLSRIPEVFPLEPSPLMPQPQNTTPPQPAPNVPTVSLAALALHLPHASAFPVSERQFACPPQQLWQAVVQLIARETDVIHLADAERGILHGEVLRRGLRPRAHRLKPLGHYLAVITPSGTPATSRLQLQILAFDWQTGKPLADAEALRRRLFATLAKNLSGDG